jgi:hypothetical protein
MLQSEGHDLKTVLSASTNQALESQDKQELLAFMQLSHINKKDAKVYSMKLLEKGYETQMQLTSLSRIELLGFGFKPGHIDQIFKNATVSHLDVFKKKKKKSQGKEANRSAQVMRQVEDGEVLAGSANVYVVESGTRTPERKANFPAASSITAASETSAAEVSPTKEENLRLADLDFLAQKKIWDRTTRCTTKGAWVHDSSSKDPSWITQSINSHYRKPSQPFIANALKWVWQPTGANSTSKSGKPHGISLESSSPPCPMTTMTTDTFCKMMQAHRLR